MRERMVGGGLVLLAVIALIGCSSSGGSAAPGSAGPSAAAPSAAAPSEAAPSAAAPSEAAASAPAASGATPSFSLPSNAKELEALIPDSLCGATVTKVSLKGTEAIGTDNDEMTGVLQSLGKSPSDVSSAMAFDTGGGKCSVFIFRIAGADEGRLRDIFKQEIAKENPDAKEVSLGGKTVVKTSADEFDYAWVKGDGVVVVAADSEANAADLISQLP